MGYPGLGLDDARAVYRLRQERSTAQFDERVVLRKSGADFPETTARDCLNQCCDLATTARDDGMSMAEFDSQCAPIVHSTLQLAPVIAGDADFWRWLTFMDHGFGAEIIDWRYGTGHRKQSASGPARPIYYGLEEIKKGMFAKLWICANVMYINGALNPYDGIEYSDVDLWDSHIIDVNFGSTGPMARAFVKVVRDLQLKRGAASDPAVPTGFRDLAKEIRRRQATIAFELFGDDEAYAWVQQLWKERGTWNTRSFPTTNDSPTSVAPPAEPA